MTQRKSLSNRCFRNNRSNKYTISKPDQETTFQFSPQKTKTHSLGQYSDTSGNITSDTYTILYIRTVQNIERTPLTSSSHLIKTPQLTNPFTNSPLQTNQRNQKPRGGRFRGERRGSFWRYISDPNKRAHHNFQEAIRKIDHSHIINTHPNNSHTNRKDLAQLQPKNLSMHNLCQETKPPLGTKNLLGLGLKFRIAPPIPNPSLKDTPL